MKWELDHKEYSALKNWCFLIVVLGKTLESPLDCKDIKPLNPKGNQSRIFIGRTDAESETEILWPSDAKNWHIWKDPDAWRWEKGTTEDEMVGWHHWLNGHEFEQAPGVGNGQGSLVCCSPWDPKELDTTERQNWTELTIHTVVWPSTPPILRTFLPFQTEILYSLKNNFTFSPVPLAPGNWHSIFLSLGVCLL